MKLHLSFNSNRDWYFDKLLFLASQTPESGCQLHGGRGQKLTPNSSFDPFHLIFAPLLAGPEVTLICMSMTCFFCLFSHGAWKTNKGLKQKEVKQTTKYVKYIHIKLGLLQDFTKPGDGAKVMHSYILLWFHNAGWKVSVRLYLKLVIQKVIHLPLYSDVKYRWYSETWTERLLKGRHKKWSLYSRHQTKLYPKIG